MFQPSLLVENYHKSTGTSQNNGICKVRRTPEILFMTKRPEGKSLHRKKEDVCVAVLQKNMNSTKKKKSNRVKKKNRLVLFPGYVSCGVYIF